jgi:hypothetical protein
LCSTVCRCGGRGGCDFDLLGRATWRARKGEAARHSREQTAGSRQQAGQHPKIAGAVLSSNEQPKSVPVHWLKTTSANRARRAESERRIVAIVRLGQLLSGGGMVDRRAGHRIYRVRRPTFRPAATDRGASRKAGGCSVSALHLHLRPEQCVSQRQCFCLCHTAANRPLPLPDSTSSTLAALSAGHLQGF